MVGPPGGGTQDGDARGHGTTPASNADFVADLLALLAGADSAASPARDGALMTPTKDATAGGRGGDGNGLRQSATEASTQAVSGTIMAGQRPDTARTEQRRLPIPRSAIESSERPMAVVGRGPSGKSR